MAICHGLTRFIYDADKIQGFSQDIALSIAVDGTAESRVHYTNIFALSFLDEASKNPDSLSFLAKSGLEFFWRLSFSGLEFFENAQK